jgi:hypothetical protein
MCRLRYPLENWWRRHFTKLIKVARSTIQVSILFTAFLFTTGTVPVVTGALSLCSTCRQRQKSTIPLPGFIGIYLVEAYERIINEFNRYPYL